MIKTSGNSPTITAAVVAIVAMAIAAAKIGGICPSVCPSDWDKRETPVVSALLEATYGWRFQAERRGQDSNLRTSYPVTDLANPRFRPLSHLSKSLYGKDYRRFAIPRGH